MKFRLASLLISMFFSHTLFAQTWDELVYLGKEAHKKGELEKAVELLTSAADLKGDDNYEWYLYAGILAARLEDHDKSFILLRKSVRSGMWDAARLERNTRLSSLQEDPRWQVLISDIDTYEASYIKNSGLTHPEVRSQLKAMWRRDQELVGKWEQQKKVINSNTGRLRKLVEEHGWPTHSMVGKDGSWFAWAIAQHSLDLEFQRECLALMERLLEEGEVNPTLFAELSDRIARNSGAKQIYGMAIITEDGDKAFYPIENEKNVDQRRSKIGLPPLKVWANVNHIDYD